MATNESEKNARGKPANDSIDELLDGVPADPILPKKRARPMDQAGPPSSKNRRFDDKVIVRDETDPTERARREAEAQRRQSSTFGTSFLGPNATRQKLIVGVVMMLAVLGIYAFVRTMTKKSEAQNVQNTSSSPIASAAPPAAASSPTPPAAATMLATASTAAAAAPTSVGGVHHPRVRTDAHAAPNSSVAQPASTHGAGFSGL